MCSAAFHSQAFRHPPLVILPLVSIVFYSRLSNLCCPLISLLPACSRASACIRVSFCVHMSHREWRALNKELFLSAHSVECLFIYIQTKAKEQSENTIIKKADIFLTYPKNLRQLTIITPTNGLPYSLTSASTSECSKPT